MSEYAVRALRGAQRHRRTTLTRVQALEGGWPSVVALAIPAVFIAIIGWALRWVADDGWINIRILQQTFAGNGVFTFNPQERVEAGTSTLWLILMSVLHILLPWIEWGVLSVCLGVGLTTLAIVLATLAGIRITRRGQLGAIGGFLPFGTAVMVALPPFWDFTTSGLETSLTFCWLALSFWLLVRRLVLPGDVWPEAWAPVWPSIVIGLGWLVRPDAALYAVFFAIALLVQSRPTVRGWIGSLVLALAIPGTYQLFRMGYFAALVPNTAIAKDAQANRLEDGIYYLLDFVTPYSLWFPVLLSVFVLLGPVTGWLRRREWRTIITVLSPVVPAVLHAAYVVRVGGDFMHARFLLPPTFALMLPVAVIGLRRGSRVFTAAGSVLVGWAVAVAGGARVGYNGSIDSLTDDYAGTPPRAGVANEREYWKHTTMNHETVHIDDWRASWPVLDGEEAAWDKALGRSYYRDPELLGYLYGSSTYDERRILDREVQRRKRDPKARPAGELWPLAPGRQGIYLVAPNMGIKGVVAGVDVTMIDRLSLTDAVTARAKAEHPAPTRVGHRPINPAWQAALYADTGGITNRHLDNARAALRCGDLPELIAATTAPMGPHRFIANLGLAARLTTFTFPDDPTKARAVLCGSAPPVVNRPR